MTTAASFEMQKHFGPIDPRLPELVGRVAMLGALIESRVAAIAMSVENRSQNEYARASFDENLRTCRKRFPLFGGTEFERRTLKQATAALARASDVLQERHEVIHRIWSVPQGDVWGGYKGVRPRRSPSGRLELPDAWKRYTPGNLEELVAEMSEVVDDLQGVVGLITSFPRLPNDSPT